jgi:hypothetical protein
LARLDKKILEDVDVDANAHCLAGKCDCEDEPLLRAYVGTMGNILANCDILKVLATVQTSDERLPKVELLVDVCELLQGVTGGLLENVEAEVDINTCCDVKESLISLECLNVYLSLAELDLVRAVAASNDLVSADVILDLLVDVKTQCDTMYNNVGCLAAVVAQRPNLDVCVKNPVKGPNPGLMRKSQKSETMDGKIDRLLKNILNKHN